MKRSAFLIIGLSVLLPYLAGVLGHVTVFDIDNRRFLGQVVGAIPGFFAVGIPRASVWPARCWRDSLRSRRSRSPRSPGIRCSGSSASRAPPGAPGKAEVSRPEPRRKAAPRTRAEPAVERPGAKAARGEQARGQGRRQAAKSKAGKKAEPRARARETRISVPCGTSSCSRPRGREGIDAGEGRARRAAGAAGGDAGRIQGRGRRGRAEPPGRW